jgi:predicted nuclease of predicted toxin-antitoxin system
LIFWIDAQLSPGLAPWLSERFGIQAFSASHLGYRDAADLTIFQAARRVGAIVMTKDSDFVHLLEQLGPPPQVLWIALGNTSNARMKEVLQATLREALSLFQAGEPLVEISASGSAAAR